MERLESRTGHIGSGPRVGANSVGYQEFGNTHGFVRAKRAFWRVVGIFELLYHDQLYYLATLEFPPSVFLVVGMIAVESSYYPMVWTMKV